MHPQITRILRDCLESQDYLDKYLAHTDISKIEYPFFYRVFTALKSVRDSGKQATFENLFLELPEETRREDTARCMEISL